MRRPTPVELATVLAAVATAAGVTAVESQGVAEWLFYTVLFLVVAYAGHVAVRAARAAAAERRRAAALAELRPAVVALAAVREERRRLTAEIATSLRGALVGIVDDADPAHGVVAIELRLGRIRSRTHQATSDLRRHLGLLREPPAEPPQSTAVAPAGIPPRRDVVLAASMAVLAGVESVAYEQTEHYASWSVWSVVLTVLAAATVVGRTVALTTAALACAAFFALGTLLDGLVVEGFWILGSVCPLLWAVASRAGRDLRPLVAGAALATSILVTRRLDSPDNVVVAAACIAVSVVAGLLVRVIRSRELAAGARAALRESELRVARESAVEAERATLARELHDVASHAVGVIAAQTGAAEVSWRRDPDAALRALAVVGDAARTALAELDRLPTQPSEPRSADDLEALVGRVRAAGVPVDLTLAGDPPAESWQVVHRVVQECLTNVLRHAPGATATVRVAHLGDATEVVVTDDGPGPAARRTRGYGLVGLAERVAFAGGDLDVGAGPGGRGFRVRALLPAATPAVTT